MKFIVLAPLALYFLCEIQNSNGECLRGAMRGAANGQSGGFATGALRNPPVVGNALRGGPRSSGLYHFKFLGVWQNGHSLNQLSNSVGALGFATSGARGSAGANGLGGGSALVNTFATADVWFFFFI